MTYETVRQAIVTETERAKTAWTAYSLLVDYDNKDRIDLESLTTPYVCVDIVWLDGQQMDLGRQPLVTDYGQIVVAAGVKEGGGTNSLLKLLDHFKPYLQLRDNIGASVRTEAAMLTRPVTRRGFYFQPMLVPFWVTAQAPAAA